MGGCGGVVGRCSTQRDQSSPPRRRKRRVRRGGGGGGGGEGGEAKRGAEDEGEERPACTLVEGEVDGRGYDCRQRGVENSKRLHGRRATRRREGGSGRVHATACTGQGWKSRKRDTDRCAGSMDTCCTQGDQRSPHIDRDASFRAATSGCGGGWAGGEEEEAEGRKEREEGRMAAVATWRTRVSELCGRWNGQGKVDWGGRGEVGSWRGGEGE